jgi:hypothetical protein
VVFACRTQRSPAGSGAARETWSSAGYDAFGLYTGFNGALAAWAAIAAS